MMASQMRLEIIEPNGDVIFHDLNYEKGITNIGRDPGNDVVIDNPGVAPFHLLLDHRQQPFQIILLGSETATFLEGERLKPNAPTTMYDWSTIQMAGHTITLATSQTAATEKAPRATPLGDPTSAFATVPPDVTDEIIIVEVPGREWTVDVGQAASMQVTVANGGELVAQFEIAVDGLDADWVIVSPPEVRLNERARGTASILITPPRTPSSRAGTHFFSIVVRSPTYPGHVSRTGASVTINPYYSFAVGELSPGRQIISAFREAGEAKLEIRNQGNHETILRLRASDEEQSCRFEFQVADEDARLTGQAQLTLAPKGDSEQEDGAATVGIVITPKSRKVVALRDRTRFFTVTVSPTAGIELPRSVTGQLQIRPLVGPWRLALIVLIVAGTILAAGWPRIGEEGTGIEPEMVDAGESVTLRWRVSPFVTDLQIEGSGLEGRTFSVPQGEETVVPRGPVAVYTLRVDNLLSRLIPLPRGKEREKQLSVLVRPQAPVIHAFAADKRTVARGEPVTIQWSASYAERLILKAGDYLYDLSPDQQAGQRTFSIDKDTLFSLEARSLGGADLSSAMVWHESPKIRLFQVAPARIAAGSQVTLTWHVEGVDSVTITPFPGLYPARDSMIDLPTKTTKYVLSAVSGEERVITTSQVIVLPPPPDRE